MKQSIYAFPAQAGTFAKHHARIPPFAGKALFIFSLLLLSACAAQLPTSQRLEMVRIQKQAVLADEMAQQGLQLGQPALIRVFKSENIVETWIQDQETGRMRPFKTYPICNYSGELGPKLAEGDHQAPEGFYEISANQMNPWSQYHLSFNIGFPNEYDRAHRRTGSNLMIHGDCKSEGCYALTDPAIEEIYLLTEASIAGGRNVPVHIFPFRMTPRNMARHTDNEWLPFWQNLKEGYDAFELTQIPPKISLRMTHTGTHYAVKMPGNQKVATAF